MVVMLIRRCVVVNVANKDIISPGYPATLGFCNHIFCGSPPVKIMCHTFILNIKSTLCSLYLAKWLYHGMARFQKRYILSSRSWDIGSSRGNEGITELSCVELTSVTNV